jgi:precorrin-3B synthase
MTRLPHLRKGWCPGALRPMASGDGLLLRVRPRAGAFSIEALGAIARTAARCGSGEIDLTNRGNLQLRGIGEDTYSNAVALLKEADLLDDEAGAESVRNVVVDPLSGVDPARANLRDVAARLEESLSFDQGLWSLPGKFGFSFSGSHRPWIGGGPAADIMVWAASDGGLAIGLDGDLTSIARTSEDGVLGVLLRLAKVFLDIQANDPGVTRMKGATARFGSAEVFARAGVAGSPCAVMERTSGLPVGVLGRPGFAAGIGLPFGRIRAEKLQALCQNARDLGVAKVHTGPGRVLIFPAGFDAAIALVAEAEKLNLITSPEEVRLLIDVCPGAPACRNATTDTRRDAQNLIATLNRALAGLSLHISGCEKGCARPGAAALTLVARSGLYDIIRDDGPGGATAVAGVAPERLEEAITGIINGQVP